MRTVGGAAPDSSSSTAPENPVDQTSGAILREKTFRGNLLQRGAQRLGCHVGYVPGTDAPTALDQGVHGMFLGFGLSAMTAPL